MVVGGVILFPSLGLLFRLSVTGRFRADAATPAAGTATLAGEILGARWPARMAVAFLVAGFGLLNVANAGWAHAVGVVCLLSFVVSGFGAIIRGALAEAG